MNTSIHHFTICMENPDDERSVTKEKEIPVGDYESIPSRDHLDMIHPLEG